MARKILNFSMVNGKIVKAYADQISMGGDAFSHAQAHLGQNYVLDWIDGDGDRNAINLHHVAHMFETETYS